MEEYRFIFVSCFIVATERKFTLRQKLCYTAIVKFAVTNSMWDVNKSRIKKNKKEFGYFNPHEQTFGIEEDALTLYFNRLVDYAKCNPTYDQESPYLNAKWYVHVEDPNYKPRFPKKPWDPSDKVDWAPRKTTLGYEPDPQLEALRKRRKDAKRRASFREKLKEAEEGTKAPTSKRASGVGVIHSPHPHSAPASFDRSSPRSSMHQHTSQRQSQPKLMLISEEPAPYEEPPEVAAQSPYKAMNYYRRQSMSYYKNNRDTKKPTVRQMLVSGVK